MPTPNSYGSVEENNRIKNSGSCCLLLLRELPVLIVLKTTKERAESLELLTPRLLINKKCQDRDFQTWLQSRLSVNAGEYILDLACGDGAQSKYFDKRIGQKGFLRCVDIHEPSINSIQTHINSSKNREFIVSDMMNFDSYLNDDNLFTLAHCSFALPYAMTLLL